MSRKSLFIKTGVRGSKLLCNPKIYRKKNNSLVDIPQNVLLLQYRYSFLALLYVKQLVNNLLHSIYTNTPSRHILLLYAPHLVSNTPGCPDALRCSRTFTRRGSACRPAPLFSQSRAVSFGLAGLDSRGLSASMGPSPWNSVGVWGCSG